MMSELRVRLQQLQHRHMTALLQQMGRVFNVTPICASKETGQLQVTRTSLTGKLQPEPRCRPVISLRQLMV